jgi:hypothetical protein
MGMPKKQTGIGITGIPDHSFFHLKSNKSMRYEISKSTAPTMPTLGKGTECIKLLLSQASKGMHEPLVPMFFPVFGTHQRRRISLTRQLYKASLSV